MYILLCDCSVSSINIDGMLLKPNAVIITDLNDNDEPSFGEVCHLYMNENWKVLLELNLLENVEYDSHFHSWKVKRTVTFNILPFKSLYSKQVLIARPCSSLFLYVTLKYAV